MRRMGRMSEVLWKKIDPVEEEVLAWTAILSSKSGRRVVWQLLQVTGFLSALALENLDYAAGKHSIGAFIFSQIKNVDASFLATMIKEDREGIYDIRGI